MLFEKPMAPTHGAAAGMRMLVAFLAVGVGVFFALRWAIARTWVHDSPTSRLVFVGALLLAFVVVQRFFVATTWAAVGLRRFASWTRRERLYLAQMIPLAAVMFSFLFRGHVRSLVEQHGLAGFLLVSVPTGLLWGMVQEFLYRGWLQTELTRRFGSVAGLLAANAAFTFGPLHSVYLFGAGGVRWGVLAAVFGIGLIFSILYRRSGNLWIPAVLHGLWPLNMA